MSGRHIVIDALAARFGGTAYAAVHLARLAAEQEGVARVTVITRRDSIVDAGLRESERLTVVRLPDARRCELFRRVAWEALRLPHLVASTRADALVTLAGMLPRRVGAPVVSYLLNPVPFEDGGAANRLRRRAIRRTSRRAAAVAVPSSSMAAHVTDATGVSPVVVPLGIEHEVFRPPPEPPADGDLLYVADFYPHKRHDLVLDAWAALPEPRPRLRLIGNPDIDETCRAEVQARAAGLDGERITIEEKLPLAALVSAYREARLFVLPSEHESFSMPLLESLACGVPAVVRDIPALRETGGPGCVAVEGDDPRRWAAAVAGLLADGERHGALRREAIAHAATYSWARTTAGILDLCGCQTRRSGAMSRWWPRLAAAFSGLLAVLVGAAMIAARDVPTSEGPGARALPNGPMPVEVEFGGTRTVYAGDVLVVPPPVPVLGRVLGTQWRRMQASTISLRVLPPGQPGPFASVHLVAHAPRPARLQIATSRGERALTGVGPGAGSVVAFGPFRPNDDGSLQIALSTVAARDGSAGPAITLSPVEAQYLESGQAILRQRALHESRDGLSGLWLPRGARAPFAVAPGPAGPVTAHLTAVAEGGTARVTVRVGDAEHSGRVGTRATRLRIGPFPVARERVTVQISGSARRTLVGGLRLVRAR